MTATYSPQSTRTWLWLATLCITSLGLTLPAAAQGKPQVIATSEVFCEQELRERRRDLELLRKEVESLGTPLDSARLLRAHADWTRFVGTECASSALGSPTSGCCELRATEQRIVDHHLLLAQLRPAELRTWGNGTQIDEKNLLVTFLTGRNPRLANPTLPSSLLRVGERQYLLAYATAREHERCLEYVNLRTGAAKVLLEGIPTIVRRIRDKDESPYVLIEMVHIDRRIRWQEYHLLSLARAGDQLVANDQRLAVFKEDAGAGRCDQHSVDFLRMDRALIANGVEYPDVDGDGTQDIVIRGTEIECRSQAESSFENIYLARESGFEQHRVMQESAHRNGN